MLHTDSNTYHPSQTLLSNQMITNHFHTQSYFMSDPTRFYRPSTLVNPHSNQNQFLPSYHRTQAQVSSNRVYVPVVVPPGVHSQQHISPPVTRLRLHNTSRSCSFPAPRPKTSQKTILELLEAPTLEESMAERRVLKSKSKHKRRSNFNMGGPARSQRRKKRMTYV